MIRILLFLQFIVLVVSSFYGHFNSNDAFSLIFIDLAFFYTIFYFWKKNRDPYSFFLTMASVLYFVGDIFNNKIIPGGIMLGMVSFGLGHIIFILGIIKTIKESEYKLINRGFLAGILVYNTIFFLIWATFIRPSNEGKVFIAGSIVYGLLLTSMSSMIASIYYNNKVYFLSLIGTWFFIISDCLLAATFVTTIPAQHFFITFTYYLSLSGMIYSNKKNHMKNS